jgi:hypothetical protein
MSTVRIDIYNSNGQFLESILNRRENAGLKEFSFSPPGTYASGVYFVKISAMQKSKVCKILYVK